MYFFNQGEPCYTQLTITQNGRNNYYIELLPAFEDNRIVPSEYASRAYFNLINSKHAGCFRGCDRLSGITTIPLSWR